MPATTPWQLIVIFFVISIIHELGHLACARALRLEVKQLAIGLGPSLMHLGKGIDISINLIPLGGYLDIDGDKFDKLNLKQLACLLLSGVLCNLITAILSLGLLVYIFDHHTINGLSGGYQEKFLSVCKVIGALASDIH